MFLGRMVFFRLHESPRYLVHAGRPQEALESLQMISKFNGSDLSLALEDVDDQKPQTPSSPRDCDNSEQHGEDSAPFLPHKSLDGAGDDADSQYVNSNEDLRKTGDTIFDAGITHYSSTGESSTPLGAHVFAAPTVEYALSPSLTREISDLANAKFDANSEPDGPNPTVDQPAHMTVDVDSVPRHRPLTHARRRSHRLLRRASSIYERKVCRMLPHWLRRPIWAWWDRVMLVLAPEWLSTTLLVWAAWWAMSLGVLVVDPYKTQQSIYFFFILAYTMFNVFLPKLLETSGGSGHDDGVAIIPKTLEESLWDVVIFTLGGCPGAIVKRFIFTCIVLS